jgi:uncharacterized protein YsxB (DUF464 family)
MISVLFLKDKDDHCVGFHFEGHAEYADPGGDIVCSAASVLVINTMNALEAFTEDTYSQGTDEERGMVDVSFPEGLSHDADLLIRSLIMGVTSLEEQYGDYIHVEFEEV